MISQNTGTYFNIQHFSVHDGYGIRTVVFFKGCPLRCRWCSNPESQSFTPELSFDPSRCIGCRTCLLHTKSGVMSSTDEGIITFSPEKIQTSDFEIAKFCPSKALTFYGEQKPVKEIIDIVEKDSVFYASSNGGMTISGGEPFAQPIFFRELVEEARSRRINCIVESCGYADISKILDTIGTLQGLFYDIKHMDPIKHEEVTGKNNKRILENILLIRRTFPELPITIRTPVIPGVNDTEKEITDIALFVRDNLPHAKLELLPFHRYCLAKYKHLQRDFFYENIDIDPDLVKYLQEIAKNCLSS